MLATLILGYTNASSSLALSLSPSLFSEQVQVLMNSFLKTRDCVLYFWIWKAQLITSHVLISMFLLIAFVIKYVDYLIESVSKKATILMKAGYRKL